MATNTFQAQPDENAGWVQGPRQADVLEQTVYFLDSGGDGVVIINVQGEFTAFRNACLHQDLPIHAGYLTADGLLLCPWHNWCYDVKDGACVTAPGARLKQYPLRVEDERIWVKVD